MFLVYLSPDKLIFVIFQQPCLMCVYVGYTELTCIPDLGLNTDIEGQVLSPRSLVCVSMCECVPPCMLN